MNTIKVLLLTGANNHDWRRSTPFLKQLLEQSGKFSVDLTENPEKALIDRASLSNYDLFFVDYNGPDWGEQARENFSSAVEEGTGVLIYHAADNSFPGWVEYEKMVGLAWRDGTGHGQFHEFMVHITKPDHPITQGVEDFNTMDELYHCLVHMHGVPYEVLATAYSDPDTGGTGQDEPILLTLQYGKGRIVHHVLGHIWAGDPNGEYKGASYIALENPGFQNTLLRGCEWAAVGTVTI